MDTVCNWEEECWRIRTIIKVVSIQGDEFNSDKAYPDLRTKLICVLTAVKRSNRESMTGWNLRCGPPSIKKSVWHRLMKGALGPSPVPEIPAATPRSDYSLSSSLVGLVLKRRGCSWNCSVLPLLSIFVEPTLRALAV